jgi:hypothetical protein
MVIKPSKTLVERIQSLGSESFDELDEPTDEVLEKFPDQPVPNRLHIYVRLPADGEWFYRPCLLTMLMVSFQFSS